MVSLQVGAGPVTQTPATHGSPTVQALPSLQVPLCGVWVQTEPSGAQASSVHWLPSLQSASVSQARQGRSSGFSTTVAGGENDALIAGGTARAPYSTLMPPEPAGRCRAG